MAREQIPDPLDILDYLMELPSDLHLAAQNADAGAVREMLEAGADPNAPADPSGRTPLHYAFCRRRGERWSRADADVIAVVKTLVDAGADVNALAGKYWTPLSVAVQNGDPGAVKALLDAGADLRGYNNYSPLHLAAWRRDSRAYSVVKLLLDEGVDVNAQDDHGATPLHEAMRSNADGVVRLLIESGANRKARDQFGQTPWGVATRYHGVWFTILWHLRLLFRQPPRVGGTIHEDYPATRSEIPIDPERIR